MPKIGKKKKLKRDIDYILLFRISQHMLNPPEPEVLLQLTSDYLVHCEIVDSSRYASDRIPIPKVRTWYQDILPSLRGTRFRQQLRMNQATFESVASIIKDTSTFGQSKYTDDNLKLQLAVAMFRFGRSGNGASTLDVSSRFGISEGSMVNYTHNIVKALCSLRPQYIMWPTRNQMRAITSRMTEKGFTGCIGAVDGTSVPFYDKPLEDPEDYFSRKQEYAMQLQLIVDDTKRIIHMYTGMPASVHDSTVFRRSNVEIPENHFVLGDSAYANTETVITPFRRRIGPRPAKQRVFNLQLSSVRVCVEHAIGILKNRFQSLRELRIRVDKENGHRRACEWITACCVLHNIIQEYDPWSEMDPPDDDEADEEPVIPGRAAGNKRNTLMEHIWNLKQNGEL